MLCESKEDSSDINTDTTGSQSSAIGDSMESHYEINSVLISGSGLEAVCNIDTNSGLIMNLKSKVICESKESHSDTLLEGNKCGLDCSMGSHLDADSVLMVSQCGAGCESTESHSELDILASGSQRGEVWETMESQSDINSVIVTENDE